MNKINWYEIVKVMIHYLQFAKEVFWFSFTPITDLIIRRINTSKHNKVITNHSWSCDAFSLGSIVKQYNRPVASTRLTQWQATSIRPVYRRLHLYSPHIQTIVSTVDQHIRLYLLNNKHNVQCPGCSSMEFPTNHYFCILNSSLKNHYFCILNQSLNCGVDGSTLGLITLD